LFLSLASVLLAVFVSVPSPLLTQPVAAASLPAGDDAVVSRVVSGDTLEVKINGVGFTIGYLGIDAPNAASASAKAECYSAQATAFNSRLVSRQTLRIEREVSDFETNGSGRLLRWVFLPDGRLVNEEMVKAGYALASNAAPDQKYMARLIAAQQTAQAAKLGMWGACPGIAQKAVSITPVPAAQAASAASSACPTAEICITSPASGTTVTPGTIVVFEGTATHTAFARYQFLAGDGTNWGHIADFTQPVVNGTLMQFHTNTLAPGTYTIRLQVIDASGNALADKAEITLTIGWGTQTYTPPSKSSTSTGGSASASPSACVRTGAICSDGWRSSATGRGACSHHGGVAQWLCQ
jgi:endonuclease YncB( thermonuclease family)